jgi:hypothetical protein
MRSDITVTPHDFFTLSAILPSVGRFKVLVGHQRKNNYNEFFINLRLAILRLQNTYLRMSHTKTWDSATLSYECAEWHKQWSFHSYASRIQATLSLIIQTADSYRIWVFICHEWHKIRTKFHWFPSNHSLVMKSSDSAKFGHIRSGLQSNIRSSVIIVTRLWGTLSLILTSAGSFTCHYTSCTFPKQILLSKCLYGLNSCHVIN